MFNKKNTKNEEKIDKKEICEKQKDKDIRKEKIKKEKIKRNRDITIYVVLRILVILTIILQLLRGNFENVFVCVLTLILFTIPSLIDRRFNIKLPNVLEGIILLFIFSAEILRRSSKFLWNNQILGHYTSYNKWLFMWSNWFFFN